MDRFLAPVQEEMQRVEECLDRALSSDVAMVHEIARYMSELRGKRLRPALALLGAKATASWDDRIIAGAAAVEMIHAATMIHDDVVDSATMRRGNASVNSVWSGQVAVLMGDFLLARALGMLGDLGNLEALGAVTRATERLSQGEIFEIHISRETDTSRESYFAMVGDKTASLISAACTLGPYLAGAPATFTDAMGAYGEALGLAFQIADDVLDFTGDARTLGKPVGHDLQEGKITLPLIMALGESPESERAQNEALLRKEHKSPDDGLQVVRFVEEWGGVQAARDLAMEYADKAQACLRELPLSPAREVLELGVRLVVNRNS